MSGLWIEVDLDAVKFNYGQVVSRLSPGSRCMAVVKADAYGLGAPEVARALEQAGCEAFAVTSVAEGIVLRENGIQGLILVLGPSDPQEWPAAVRAGLSLTIAAAAAITELEKISAVSGREAFVHLKLESGMGRTGLWPEDIAPTARALTEAAWVQASGIYTHFSRAAQRDERYTRKQYEKFCQGVAQFAALGIEPAWRHVCNSAAFLDYPAWHHDFVRIGTLLIGHYPQPAFRPFLPLKDPWRAKSRIQYVRQAPKGTCVGYQSLYKTRRDTELAVIFAGYADGFGVEPHMTPQGFFDLCKVVLKNIAACCGVFLGREKVTLKGRAIRVAGKIGMQLTVLDVGVGTCQVGDEVEVPLRRTLANPRLPRKYWEDGRRIGERRLREEFYPAEPERSDAEGEETGR
ncbi:MAG: alanine racemase [Peptococcaceae bacterium]|nr:alanine racemase [Peptococcaceae bacterium]